MYGKVLIDHLEHPRNFGELVKPEGTGLVESPLCGDVLRIDIVVENEHIAYIGYHSESCGATIAAASLTTEMVKGKRLDEALKVTSKKIARKLGGLPESRIHCAILVQDALKMAIEDYRGRQGED